MIATRNSAHNYKAIEAEIIARLDLRAEYEQMGVTFENAIPRPNGNMPCFALGRDDRRASAVVLANGRFHDSSTDESFSLWEFAVKYSVSPTFTDDPKKKWPAWKVARQYFADKAGVSMNGRSAGAGNSNGAGGGKGKSNGAAVKPRKTGNAAYTNPLDQLHFLSWTKGIEQLARIWGKLHKNNISVEAIKMAGGQVARWKCYPALDKTTKKPTGEKRLGNYMVIALPCFAPDDATLTPRAWVIWSISGQLLEVYAGEGKPTNGVKMRSIGETRGLMMGLHGLDRLQSGSDGKIEEAFKTAGPSDMLALLTAMSPDQRDRYPVVTNASGETGSVTTAMAELFLGHRAVIVPDCDTPGIVGAKKWLNKWAGVASESKSICLPYKITENHGRDLRGFLGTDEQSLDGKNRHTFDDLLAIVRDTEPYSRPAAEVAGENSSPQSVVVDNPTALPEIEITTNEPAVIDQAIKALEPDPAIYKRGNVLACILRDEKQLKGIVRPPDASRIAVLPSATLREKMAGAARSRNPGH